MHSSSMINTFDGNGHCPQTLSLHLLVERARGVSSFWAPFVARLPDQVRERSHSRRQPSQVATAVEHVCRCAQCIQQGHINPGCNTWTAHLLTTKPALQQLHDRHRRRHRLLIQGACACKPPSELPHCKADIMVCYDHQVEHPLLWGLERAAWLVGSPMARTLADRLQQVQEVGIEHRRGLA